MIDLIRQHRRFFLWLTLAAVALRLFFIIEFPVTEGDTLVYGDIAKNWLDHHVFGQTINGEPEPTLIRLPGYPAFLAVCFTLFGREQYNAVRIVQLLMDLGTCFLVADLARRIIGERAALVAFVLAALCPFTANYVALPLAETPSILLTTLALWFAVRGLDSDRAREWVGCGLATAANILMRPDNGIVLAVIGGYVLVNVLFLNARTGTGNREAGTEKPGSGNREAGNEQPGTGKREPGTENQRTEDREAGTQKPGSGNREVGTAVFKSRLKTQKSKIERAVIAIALIGVIAIAPLVPWTVRNGRVFHVFQPLAARYANNPDEDPYLGFQRWTKTWMGEYVSVVEIYWHVTGEEVDPQLLPSRAFDSAEERQKTSDIFAAYNQDNALRPELDDKLAQLARERIRHRPLRYYVWLPAARIVDMWLRPRTAMLGIMERWWEYWVDPVDFSKAVAYGLLNLAYVVLALWGMLMQRKRVRYAGLLISFFLLRSLFLGTLENPEPRYTLEMFPVVFIFAAAALAGQREMNKRPMKTPRPV
jgi:hypothetical protein